MAPAAVNRGAREASLRALSAGRLDGMGWVTEAWIERATDPAVFLPGCRSLIVLGLPARSPAPALPAGGGTRGRVARYAWGRDYHRVFEARLRRLARRLRDEFGCETRATVDYGPLLERPLAALAGAGWLGRSTMLLVPGAGPWLLLGVVATTLELEAGQPLRKSCGSCSRCVVACPTGALGTYGGGLDARLCISYHTIENRGPIPRALRSKFGDWVFGCDGCLDSCPVGAGRFEADAEFRPATADAAFPPLAELLALDQAAFVARFRGRAVSRARRDGLVRNACVALGNVGRAEDLGAVLSALADSSPLVRGHAAWALGRLVERGVVGADSARVALEIAGGAEADSSASEEIEAALASILPALVS